MESGEYASGGSFRKHDKSVPAGTTVGGLPLSMAAVGDIGRIVKITGNEDTRKFLTNLGFTVDSEVAVLSRLGKNLIVSVKDSRVAMNSDAAACLYYIPM